MKKILLIELLVCLATVSLKAQTSYEAARLLDGDLNGTARFIGMGGAMGALGCDVSVISTNPAGIGLYRCHDINASLNIYNIGTKGGSHKDNFSKTALDNVGFVYSTEVDEGSLKFLNVGFSYKMSKNFSKDFLMEGSLIDNDLVNSQQLQMSNMLNQFDGTLSGLGLSYYDLNDIQSVDYRYAYAQSGNNRYYVPWLVLLAGDAKLLNNSNAEPYFLPTDCYYRSEERGGISEYDFNLSCNLNDQVYLGLTVGFHEVDYDLYSYYEENDNQGFIYSLENWYRTEGTGFNFKLGTIIRPVEDSPFKIGFAIHSPTWYRLTDISSAIIYSEIDGVREMDTQWSDAYGGDYYTDYKITTPWRFNLSAGYTIGSFMALGAEYEYCDYSTAKMKYDDGDEMTSENDVISEDLKAVNTLKFGVEVMPVSKFAIRAGYNIASAAFNDDAWKWIPSNSTITNTAYMNSFKKQNYTLGIGYQGEFFYLDAAYQRCVQKADFYPFTSSTLKATKVTTNLNQVTFTAGFRF